MPENDLLQKVADREIVMIRENVVLSPVDSTTFSLIVSFRDGCAWESDENWGWSHFLEHANFLKTDRYDSLASLTTVMESLGGRISAFTTRDCVTYYVHAPLWALEKSFEVLSSLVCHNAFSQDLIDKEKQVVFQEMEREKVNGRVYYPLLFEGALLKDMPISRYGLGSRESIEPITAQSLGDYKKSVYCRENLTLSLTGGFELRRGQKLAEDFLHRLPCGIVREPVVFVKKSTLPQRLEYEYGASPTQVQLMCGWTFDDISNWLLVALFGNLLGSGFTGLLCRTLRQQHQITYYVTSPLKFYGNFGTLRIILDLAAEKLPLALELIDETLRDIAQMNISGDDFLLAKKKTWGNHVFNAADMYEYGSFLSKRIQSRTLPFSMLEIAQGLERITMKDLASFARIFTKKSMNLAICGNAKALGFARSTE